MTVSTANFHFLRSHINNFYADPKSFDHNIHRPIGRDFLLFKIQVFFLLDQLYNENRF